MALNEWGDVVKDSVEVTFTARITYADSKRHEDYVNKTVTLDGEPVHTDITDAYLEFLNGCGFVVTNVEDLVGG